MKRTNYTINVNENQRVRFTWQTKAKMITANALAWVILVVSFVMFVTLIYEHLFGV